MPGRHIVGLAVCERIARNAALRRSAGLIADQLALGGNDLADPTLREAHHGPQMRDGVALGGRPYHFFARCSRSAATSNICSSSSFFSLAVCLAGGSLQSILKLPGDRPPCNLEKSEDADSHWECHRAPDGALSPARDRQCRQADCRKNRHRSARRST